jgi:hypothetical protein
VATRLRFRAVQDGSVAAVLEVPGTSDDGNVLPLETSSLGELAVLATLAALNADSVDSGVAGALVQLAEDVGVGGRHEGVLLSVEDESGPLQTARLDTSTRERLRDLADPHRREEERPLVGRLVEADFERLTARLRTAAGDAVSVQFPVGQADTIQEALRRPAEVEGRVVYDASAGRAISVELRRLVTDRELPLAAESRAFYRERSVHELVRRDTTGATTDADLLRDEEASDDEVDAFLAVLDT